MKAFSIILFLSIMAFLALFFILGQISRSGKAPGVVDGKLSRCPDQPNCVCSEYKNDSDNYVEPVRLFRGAKPEIMSEIKKVILDMGGSIQAESEHYIACTFTSSLFRFVDDFEARIEPAEGLVHIRSKSRVGYSDLGVNRKRVDLFKRRLVEESSLRAD